MTLIVCVATTTQCGSISNKFAFLGHNSNQELNEVVSNSQLYKNASKIIWEVGTKRTSLEALVEVPNTQQSITSSEAIETRLIITNLADNKIIFQKNTYDTFISMYTRRINETIGEVLIINWAAGSADRIELFDVSETQAKTILSESYRQDAALIDLSGKGNLDVLITTASGGSQLPITTRYEYLNGEYHPTGKVSFNKFKSLITESFSK